uniref:Uncharacterized protein n=1 Tax=viral metagenome TaxID=1070528 RepID=A0A6M3LVV5_9ZZZZ
MGIDYRSNYEIALERELRELFNEAVYGEAEPNYDEYTTDFSAKIKDRREKWRNDSRPPGIRGRKKNNGNGQIASGASVKIISNEIKRWCKMNIQKISLFWLKKLRLAKTMKEKIRAMTALTAIEKHASYISRILDQASQGLAK